MTMAVIDSGCVPGDIGPRGLSTHELDAITCAQPLMPGHYSRFVLMITIAKTAPTRSETRSSEVFM